MFNKKSRRKVALILLSIFSITLLFSMYTNHQEIALAALNGLIWVGGLYLASDGYRKSEG